MPSTLITIEWKDRQGHSHSWIASEQADGESFVYRETMDNLPINNGTINEDDLEGMIYEILARTVQ